MSKTLIVDGLVKDIGVTKATAARIVNSIQATSINALADTGRFSLPGLGALAVKQAAARESRNPRTGAKLTVPARKKVKFTEGSTLKSLTTAFKVAM